MGNVSPPTVNVPVGCLDCGLPPPLSLSGPRTTLTTIFHNRIEQLRPLYTAGIVDDRHLEILLGWRDDQRDWFVQMLEAEPFEKRTIVIKLCRYKMQHSRHKEGAELNESKEGQRGTYGWVRQPGERDEEYLTNPKVDQTLLIEAMQLDEESSDHYREIEASTFRKSQREWTLNRYAQCLLWDSADAYIRTYRPSQELFEDTIRKIVRTYHSPNVIFRALIKLFTC